MANAEIISLLLNRRSIRATEKFKEFLHHWDYISSLAHLKKDLDTEKIIKIGFNRKEKEEIENLPTMDARRNKIVLESRSLKTTTT